MKFFEPALAAPILVTLCAENAAHDSADASMQHLRAVHDSDDASMQQQPDTLQSSSAMMSLEAQHRQANRLTECALWAPPTELSSCG
eukprot:4280797-Prymnesium_polylepis.1